MKQVFELQLPALMYFVKESCHENLHDTLNDLNKMSKDIQVEKDETVPEELHKFLRSFIKRMKQHLALEEKHIFPMFNMGRDQSHSIDHLVDDHDHMKLDLIKLRNMTGNYMLAFEEGLTTSKFYEKLMEMDRIILNHIQIEDNVLFPMVLNCG